MNKEEKRIDSLEARMEKVEKAISAGAAKTLGSLSHSKKSEHQAAASRENGKKGGRPKNLAKAQEARRKKPNDTAI